MGEHIEMEPRLAVIEHRLGTLEQWPPRVEQVEKHMAAVQQELAASRITMEELKAEVHKSSKEASETRQMVSRLFWTGAGVLTACSVIWTGGIVLWRMIGAPV
jgi:hypothetical protein